MRVVIDTNALISRLLLARSVPARNKWDRYVSIDDRQEFIRRLLQICTLVSVLSEIDDCRDPSDNHFLALALDARASVILTGDRDLLDLHPWRGIRILTPAGFLVQYPE